MTIEFHLMFKNILAQRLLCMNKSERYEAKRHFVHRYTLVARML
jgi:hypothetical protein